ncbi:hypothetical protein L9F63_004099, partial [Diploptera punctata]
YLKTKGEHEIQCDRQERRREDLEDVIINASDNELLQEKDSRSKAVNKNSKRRFQQEEKHFLRTFGKGITEEILGHYDGMRKSDWKLLRCEYRERWNDLRSGIRYAVAAISPAMLLNSNIR